MQELRIHVQHGTNLAGIARFYSELMGAHVSYSEGDTAVTVATSPLQQRLVFEAQPEGAAVGQYSGYHVSIYIQDLESTFKAAILCVSKPHTPHPSVAKHACSAVVACTAAKLGLILLVIYYSSQQHSSQMRELRHALYSCTSLVSILRCCSSVHLAKHTAMLLLHCTLQRMDKHGLVFVSPRFNRKAETLEEAKEQAMFRVLNIIDPLHPEQGTIVQLEHEIRGTSRSSCPLNA
eukprot:6566-Heterococcus_DN1.PRE.1